MRLPCQHPANFVTWFDAARFANWMNNGQGSGDTESGAYNLQGGTPIPSNANSISRQPGATVFLPSENEWYKAAYYNPANHSYFQYPASSNAVPTGSSPTSLPNHANLIPGGPDHLTDVGAYTGTTSPYQLFDTAGDAFQWTEDLVFGSSRTYRGEGFGAVSTTASASFAEQWDLPTSAYDDFGFRLATIPEPSTFVLAAVGLVGLIAWGLRWR